MLQDNMDVESDDDDYVDAVQYEDIADEDVHITRSCKPLSTYSLMPLTHRHIYSCHV